MKTFVKKILSILIWPIGLLISYKLFYRIKGVRNSLYTLWLRPSLGSLGISSYIGYPLRLEGNSNHSIFIGEGTALASYCVLGCWQTVADSHNKRPQILIGNCCSIGEFCHITAINKIVIGNGVLTGRFVFIGDNNHGGLSWEEADIPPAKRTLKSKGDIIIGNNVWIGDKVTILGGVTIGNNVIVGANTVVSQNIPSNTTVVGGFGIREIKHLE